jgi:hypothetical protein
MRWITVGPPNQPDTSILLAPPAVDPGVTEDERRTIAQMMAKGTYGWILLATKDLEGTFERLQAGDVEVVQEPTEQPYGIRDCAFRDPAGNRHVHRCLSRGVDTRSLIPSSSIVGAKIWRRCRSERFGPNGGSLRAPPHHRRAPTMFRRRNPNPARRLTHVSYRQAGGPYHGHSLIKVGGRNANRDRGSATRSSQLRSEPNRRAHGLAV